jgi:hypothetical protein
LRKSPSSSPSHSPQPTSSKGTKRIESNLAKLNDIVVQTADKANAIERLGDFIVKIFNRKLNISRSFYQKVFIKKENYIIIS